MNLVDKTKAILGLLRKEPIKDTAELLAECQQYARTVISRDARKVQLDAELQLVKDKHEGAIEVLNDQLAHLFKRIKAWADASRAVMFPKNSQSFVIAGHELAYRKSPGAIAFEEGKDAESVVEAILNLPGVTDETPEDQLELAKLADELRATVLRVKAELEKKAAMRAIRSKSPAGTQLLALGLRVKEEESFDFTPAREQLPEITQTADSEPQRKEAA